MTIKEIRAMYPHPLPATRHAAHLIPGSYCTGGALCLARAQVTGCHANPVDYWPTPRYLGYVLQAWNPALADDTAHAYAETIINENDHNKIERAWTLAEQALTSTKET